MNLKKKLKFNNPNMLFINTTFNKTILNQSESCIQSQTFYDLNEFFKCYMYFASNMLIETIFQLLLIICTILFNTLVIIILILSKEISVFDKIIIGHSIVDGLTGLFDIPLYHISK